MVDREKVETYALALYGLAGGLYEYYVKPEFMHAYEIGKTAIGGLISGKDT